MPTDSPPRRRLGMPMLPPYTAGRQGNLAPP